MRYPLTRRVDATGEAKVGRPGTRLAACLIVVLSTAPWQGAASASGAPGVMRPADADDATPAAPLRHHHDRALPHFLRAQAQGQPVLNVSKIILAEPASETPLPIQVGPTEAITRNSFIRLRGLPASAALTEGHSIAPGAWAIPIMGLPNLKLVLPIGLSGKSEITVALVTVDGTIVAETKTALVIAAASLIAPGEVDPRSKSVASLGPGGGAQPRSDDPPARLALPPAPALSDEHKRALGFIAKGNEQLAQGNIAAARLFFQRGADAGLAQAALAMAATYDPVELDRLGARSVQPDFQVARKWYERARQLGAAEAEERLNRLGAR